jgi:hypothetical protein
MEDQHPIDAPLRRPLRIFAFDPMRGRDPLSVITIDVENEPLLPGPQGSRVKVVDYEASERRYLSPVDLDDPAVLMMDGLEPSETDPRFHQQMVYAVTMKVLENFDRALGRRIDFRGRPLLLVPHAFRGTNAYYDPDLKGVLFGYFPADPDDPGENIPGQPIFTCLSHDIIAHEVTHALVHRLRAHSLEPTNDDVLAFHEGFADIVAIFQHFSFPSVLRAAIRESHGDLASHTALADLAAQFGHATGRGNALRTAIDTPEPGLYRSVTEPHERGSILVSAVFEGFFRTYQGRVAGLLRLATGGTGVLPPGELQPDLVEELAEEAANAAQSVLTMCIRAFEYLPAMDITFGDFLRALITADRDLLAEEGADQRRVMIEAFRRRGIYPEGVVSLSEGALCWPEVVGDGFTAMPADEIARHLLRGAEGFRPRRRHRRGQNEPAIEPSEGVPEPTDPDDPEAGNAIAPSLHGWATANAELLHLSSDPKCPIRVAPSGRLVVEVIAQFTQQELETEQDSEYGGLRFRGGTTVVATASGDVRFVIAKPIASRERRERQLRFVSDRDAVDPALSWADDEYAARRIAHLSFRGLHDGLVVR